ncbi:GNAT family N-acetyltransferase [Microbacterium sp. NPDC091313]
MGTHVTAAGEGNWRDLERLFGPKGASSGCWCQYWLLSRAGYRSRDRADNKHDLRLQVRAGRAGLLALRDGEAVGWARLTPREELSWVSAHFPEQNFPDDGAWSLPCFYVANTARGSGVMRTLIRDASRRAREQGVPLEAYPIDTEIPGATEDRYSGVLAAFLAEGFDQVARLSKDRVLVRRP